VPELVVINLVSQHAKQSQQKLAGYSNGCYGPVLFQGELVVKPPQIRASGSAGKHVKVLLAIARCRTAALGGHVDQCSRCGHRASISYNSCRNRHCPKCQTAARDRWIAARQKELLPTRYVHVVFTLPAQLAPLAHQNRKFLCGLLLRAV
jgi:Transposase zinc-binding domain